MTFHNTELRIMVRGAYDLQKLRISVGNRIAGNFRAKLGQKPGEKLEDAEAKRIITDLAARYKRLTDGLVNFPTPKRFKGDEVISTWTELALIAQYVELEKQETRHFRRLENVLRDIPIYNAWLKNIRGVGPAMAGVLLSEINIERAKYPSSLWAYAGLDVAGDGKGRSRRADHLIEREYIDKDGEVKTCKSITFNPFLKTKLVGVLATSFLRVGESPYRDIYDKYKHRLEAKWPDESKGHRHNAAMRYMIKMFLIDLYKEWRAIEGLPVAPPYHEAKLGHKHAA